MSVSAENRKTPPDPIHDPKRLQEIFDLDLTSPEIDSVLQDTLAEAAERLDLPVGLVSIVLEEAQYFAAMHGVEGWLREVRGTPVEWSFCTNVVRDRQPFLVEDAKIHPLVRDIPLVDEEGIRCYAGVPLRTSNGHVLGSLCVIGSDAREFVDEEVDFLRGLAERAMERIEERRGRHDAD